MDTHSIYVLHANAKWRFIYRKVLKVIYIHSPKHFSFTKLIKIFTKASWHTEHSAKIAHVCILQSSRMNAKKKHRERFIIAFLPFLLIIVWILLHAGLLGPLGSG
jgi:hypothetical protein